jgi:membrane-associated HD superfamily phosphohydrolase
MEYSRRRRRNIWIWVGVILLSISTLFWLIVAATVVAGGQDAGFMILAGLFLSIVPIGVGIYCVWHGKRRYRHRIFY